MNEINSILDPGFYLSFFDGSLSLALLFVFIVALSKVFIKAGVTWWYAFVPVVNILYLCKVARVSLIWVIFPMVPLLALIILVLVAVNGGFKGWETIFIGLALLVIASLFSLIAMLKVGFGVARRFGKGSWFGLGLAVVPWFFYSVLGFSNVEYKEEDELVVVGATPEASQPLPVTENKM